MIRIERLLEQLRTQEPPQELESADVRLEDAAAATSRGDYQRAAQCAEEVYEAGIFDARLLGNLLYAALLERGPAALELLLRIAVKAVSENRLAFTPASRRDVLLDGSLYWFISSTLRQLELAERLHSGAEKDWEAAAERGLLDEAAAIGEQLISLVAALTPRARTPVPLRRLCARVVTMRRQLMERRAPQPAAPAKEPPAIPATSTDLAVAPTISADPPLEPSRSPPPQPWLEPPAPPPPRQYAAEAAAPPVAAATLVQASPALSQLARKMELFCALAERRDYVLAAVAAAEIQGALDRFDPRVYLPALVAPYLRALAACSDEIEPIMQQRDSLRFRTLAQLFSADPKSFGSTDPEEGR